MTSHLFRNAFLFFAFASCPLTGPRASAQDQPAAPAHDQAAPATVQGQTNAPQTQRRTRRVPTLDQQLKMLTERLTLDATQQSLVKVILERRQAELLEVYKNPSLSAVDRFNALKAVHDHAYDRIGHLLNAEQSKKFELMRPHDTSLPHPDEKTIVPPRTSTN